MKTFRIYTEDKNRQAIIDYLTEFTTAFTVIPCIGVWRGVQENSLIIELCERNKTFEFCEMIQLADYIRKMNEQEAVLVTQTEGQGCIISELGSPKF